MTVQTRAQFIAGLKKSRVMEEDSLDSWLSIVTDEDPTTLAFKLVREELLTDWQAKFLLSGRSRLMIGNYKLLSRTNQDDELGDCFEAVHCLLSRKVMMQIFPASIGEDEELREAVLKLMQNQTELDHPHLVHVYDVDQEGDRFFMVTEYVEGERLSDYPRRSLKIETIAQIIRDLVDATAHAHQAGIVHGHIIQENVLVEPSGRARLQGLSHATVKGIVSGTSEDHDAQQDYQAIATLAQNVLAEVPVDRRGDGYAQLVKISADLASITDPQANPTKELLDQWLVQHAPAQPITAAETTSTHSAADADTAVDDEFGNLDFPSEEAVPAAAVPKKSPTVSPAAAKKSAATPNPKNQRFLIGGVATALIVILLGIGYWLSLPAAAPVAHKPIRQQPTTQKPPSTKRQTSPAPAKEKEKANAKASPPTAPSDASSGAIKPRRSQDDREKGVATTPADPASRGTTDKTPIGTTSNPSTQVASKSNSDAVVEPSETPSSVATVPILNTDAQSATAPSPKSPAPKTSPSANERDNPFANLQLQTELPETTDTSDVKLADVNLPRGNLLGLELLTAPEVGRRNPKFSLSLSDQARQQWDVTFELQNRIRPTVVAQIQKTPTELKFRWLPVASDMSGANYFRNCKLKLSHAENFGWLGLRNPIEVETFRFPKNKTYVKSTIEIAWLPAPKFLKIEMLPFKIEQAQDVSIEPREVEPGRPNLVFFREEKDLRFLFIEFSADVRSNVMFEAKVKIIPPNGRPQSLKRYARMNEFAELLAQRSQEAVLLNQTAQTTKRPSKVKAKDFKAEQKAIKAFADLASVQAATAQEYIQVVRSLANRKIPFEVYFNLGDHKIVLARCTPEALPLIGSSYENE